MGQKKLIRFEELKTFNNVFEYPKEMHDKWSSFFNNDNPITLELACGKGEYTIGLARMFSNKNFIGIDLKGNRIWRGAKTAIEEPLKNVAFIRSHIDKVTEYFSPNSIEEIWITFPDPQLRWGKIKKRLTHPKYLRLYQQILHKNGLIHLKTDSPNLYRFTKEVIKLYNLELIIDDSDVFSKPNVNEVLRIKTHYESLDIAGSNRIHYLKFKINNELPIELDPILKENCKDIELD